MAAQLYYESGGKQSIFLQWKLLYTWMAVTVVQQTKSAILELIE